MRIPTLLGSVMLMAASGLAVMEVAVAESDAMNFDASARQLLQESREKRTGLRFHVQGQTIGGRVVELHADSVLVANQEHGRILIRLDRIDAIAAP